MSVRTIIDYGREPSKDTLFALYGSDDAVGYFALQKYEKKLKEIIDTIPDVKETVDAYAKAIVNYAIDLREAQEDYDSISPFGGLDIDVEPIDKIALRETESGNISANVIRPAVIQELVNRRIHFEFCKKTVEVFERRKKEADGGLLSAYDAWVKADQRLQDEIQQAVEDINNKGDVLWQAALAEETAFQKKSWLYQMTHSQKHKEIQTKKDEALKMIATTVNSQIIQDKFDFRIEEHLNNAPYTGRFNGVEIEYEYIDSDEKLQQALDMAREYCKNPQNREVYAIAKDALEKAEMCRAGVAQFTHSENER